MTARDEVRSPDEACGGDATPAQRISTETMLALGVGWLGTQVFWAFHTGTMPLFLKGRTESKFWISTVLSLAGLSGCLVPPIIGYLSDRTVSRFGRRAPYIIGGTLLASLCVLILPHTGSLAGAAALSALMYGAVNVAQAPYLSLLPDVTPLEQRSTASGVMNLVGCLGLIGYFGISALLWDRQPGTVFGLVAVVMVVAVCVAVWKVRAPAAAAPPKSRTLRAHLNSLWQERPLLIFLLAGGFCWMAHWMAATFFTLFVVEELGVPEGTSQYVPMVFGIVATAAALPVGIAGDRLGRKPVLATLLAFWVAGLFAVGFARNLTDVIVAAGLTGIPFAGLMVVGYTFMLDLIPPERTAELVGLSFVTSAAPQMVGPLLAGAVIDAFGYRAIFPVAALVLFVGLIILTRVPVRPRGQVASCDLPQSR